MRALVLPLLLVGLLGACGTSSSSSPPADAGYDATGPISDDDGDASPVADAAAASAADADAAADAAAVSVTAFDATPIYFTGSDNQRTVDKPVAFPASGSWSRVILHLALTCPTQGCDPWDRFATLGLVQAASGADASDAPVIEIARFITPYKLTASWDLDVTDLQPLLAGNVTLRAFIDTWVGPGSQYGGGWLFSARFDMTPGTASPAPIAAVPIWTQRNATYGDPAKPIDAAIPQATVQVPSGASSFAVRSLVTGHGQGNAENCGEFCMRQHTITVQGKAHATNLWRADCATTAVPNQPGTWQYSRAGWCPGADVKPWTIDVTSDLAGATTATFAWSVDPYDNTCRPSAADDAGACVACELGAGCAYDGSTHTEPFFAASSLLIAYR